MSFYPSRRGLAVMGICAASSALTAVWPYSGLLCCCLANSFLLLVALCDYLLSCPIRAEDVSLRLPSILPVGREAELKMSITSRNSFQVRLQLMLEVPEALRLERGLWEVRLKPKTVTELRTGFTALRRQQVKLGPLRLRHTSRLGLLVFHSSKDEVGELTVIPDISEIRSQALQVPQIIRLVTGEKVLPWRDVEGEFDSLREYFPGMDLRKVDWKASARHYRMLMREYRLERNHHVYLALDVGRLMGTVTAGLTKVDWAIAAALRLAFVALSAGDNVGLIAFAQDIVAFVKSAKGLPQFSRLLNQMAALSPVEQETNFIRAFRIFSQLQRRRSLLVVFTDFIDRVSATLCLEALAFVRQRHVVLFVACQDAELQAALLRTPAELFDIHQQNEIFRLLDERRRVIKEMQMMNITTIDADVSHLTVRLMNRYLLMKRQQRM